MKLRVVFHTRIGEEPVGVAISIWTWLLAVGRLDFKSLPYNYSHVEIWWPDEDGKFKYTLKKRYPSGPVYDSVTFRKGFCFSSTTRGRYAGVRIAPASEVLKNPERWHYIDVETDDLIWSHMLIWAESLQGKKYDFLGLFGFFLPWNVQNKDRFYCSELISHFLWRLGILDRRHKRISPRRLAKVLAKLYHEPRQL